MSTSSNGRSSLCAFTFSDGRRCRMPRRAPHPYLCPFHARKEAQALAGQRAGQDITYHLSSAYTSACDLNSALGRLFVAVANGEIKPKAAATLAYLGQTMVQNLHLAQREYINAFGSDLWRETIRESHNQTADRIYPPPTEPGPADAAIPSDLDEPDPDVAQTESSDSVAHNSPQANEEISHNPVNTRFSTPSPVSSRRHYPRTVGSFHR